MRPRPTREGFMRRHVLAPVRLRLPAAPDGKS